MSQGQKFPRGYLKELVVSEAGPPDVCWLWPGAVDASGYGRVGVDGKVQRAHRAAYAHRHGLIPDGLVIDHLCHKRACFNPAHLEAVSLEVNNQRAIRRPRGPNKYPRGYLKALVVSEAGPSDECWGWPGYIHRSGYGTVAIDGRIEFVHRAAYAAHYGKISEGLEIDHLCRQRVCFNYRHLRAVSRADNARNTQSKSKNISGHTSVYWNVAAQKWRVQVSVEGKARYFGYYRTKEEAIKVAKETRRQLGYTH